MTSHRFLLMLVGWLVFFTSEAIKSTEFPMKQFYNFSVVSMHNTTSFDHWQCDGRAPPTSHTTAQPCCDCDDDCWKFGTCCIDVDWIFVNDVEKLKGYLENFERISLGSIHESLTCGSILQNPLNNHYEIETLYMVASCPPKAFIMYVDLCYDGLRWGPIGLVPVLGQDNYLYKNKYCALCNQVESFTYQTLEVKCVDAPEIQNDLFFLNDLYNQTQCIINVKRTLLNQNYLKTCKQEDLSGNCSAHDRKFCGIFQGTTANGYKNYFCFKCSPKFNGSAPQMLKCPTRIVHTDQSKYTFRFEISQENEKFRATDYHQTFPIWNFLELSSSFNLSQNEGFDQYLCSGKRRKCCSCNKDCMSNNTCCIDVFWNETSPVDLETYKKLLIDEREKVKYHVCSPVYPPALDKQYNVKYRNLVRSCGRNASKQDRQNCLFPASAESPSMVVPVFGSDGFTYANSFCAKCNFVSYTFVNLTLKCKSNQLLKEDASTNINNKTLGFDNVYSKFSECVLDVSNVTLKTNSCSVTMPVCNDDTLHYLCMSYYAAIGNYSNFHCRSCITNASITNFEITYCDHGPDDGCNKDKDDGIAEIKLFRWSLTLSFTDDTANLKLAESFKSNCGKGQYFDLRHSKCIDIYCPSMYVVSGLDCVPVEVPKASLGYNSSELGHDYNSLTEKLITRTYFVYYQINNEKFNHSSFKIDNLTYYFFHSAESSTLFRSNGPVNLKNLDTLIVSLQSHFATNKADFLIGMKIQQSLITSDYGLEFSRFFHGNRLCARPITIPFQMITDVKSTAVIYQNKTFDVADVSYWISFQGQQPIYHYSACDKFYLMEPCLRQLIPASQITKLANMMIAHNISNGVEMVYKANQYLPTDKGYYVCLNKTSLLSTSTRNTNHYHEILLDVEYYITIIGISISMVCYVFIILTYLMFKDFHTTAGLNNCFMCLSLLIADVMALSSMKASENTTACFIVAVIMHWSLLAAFSWTLVIAFDLVSRFSSFTLHSNKNIAMKMVHRSLVGFLIPAVVVSIAVAFDKSNTTDIGYGDFGLCWRINNLYARIALYIAPSALVILVALASLCWTVTKISKDKKSTEKYLGSKDSSKLTMIKMAIKLCVILGLSEIFGYIQIPDPKNKEKDFNLAFGFIYAVLKSFRGVMLWFVYIYGGSVKQRYKKHLRKSACRLPRKENSLSGCLASFQLTFSTTTDSALQQPEEHYPLHEI